MYADHDFADPTRHILQKVMLLESYIGVHRRLRQDLRTNIKGLKWWSEGNV